MNSPSFPSLLDCLSSDVICDRLIRPFKKFDGAGPLPLTLRRRRSYFFGELSPPPTLKLLSYRLTLCTTIGYIVALALETK